MEKLDLMAEKLVSPDVNKENRVKNIERCKKVIEKLLTWAEQNGVEIKDIKKAGGGVCEFSFSNKNGRWPYTFCKSFF